MQNYAPWTIVPVGTKVVRTMESSTLKVWEVYTVEYIDSRDVSVEGFTPMYSIDCFAPYEEKKEETNVDWLPVYITTKFIPWVSKGSVIVNAILKWKGIIVIQNDTKFPELSTDNKNCLNWLFKEHPEDFRKIN